MPLAATRSRLAPLTRLAPDPARDAPPGGECCVTCGRPAGTPFCPHCGERRATDRVYTLHALAVEVWDHFTPADNRVLRSLWTLVRRPGALATAYMRGARRPYLTPLGLFFSVNAAYFVYVGVIGQQIFDTPLRTHVSATAHADVARAMVARRVVARGMTYAAYEQRFNGVVETQAKTLVVAMVPMFALLVAAVGVRRGRSALHHLAFSFHAITALLVSVMGATVLVGIPLEYAVHRTGYAPRGLTEAVVTGIIVAPFYFWLALALRHAYGDGRAAALVKAAALTFGFGLVVVAYRALLFFTAFWAT